MEAYAYATYIQDEPFYHKRGKRQSKDKCLHIRGNNGYRHGHIQQRALPSKRYKDDNG